MKHSVRSRQHISLKTVILITAMFLISGAPVLAQERDDVYQLLTPENGIWWDPSSPGSGASFFFSETGPWIVLLYSYDNEGFPAFYSFQGDRLDLSLDRTAFGEETGLNGLRAYARDGAALNQSRGGRCLGCEYTEPVTTGFGGLGIEILFYDMNHARINVSGFVNYSQDLVPFEPAPLQMDPYDSNTVSIAMLGNGFDSRVISQRETQCVDDECITLYRCQVGCESEPAASLSGLISHSTVSGIPGDVSLIMVAGEDPVIYRSVRGDQGRTLVSLLDEGQTGSENLPEQIIIQNVYKQ